MAPFRRRLLTPNVDSNFSQETTAFSYTNLPKSDNNDTKDGDDVFHVDSDFVQAASKLANVEANGNTTQDTPSIHSIKNVLDSPLASAFTGPL